MYLCRDRPKKYWKEVIVSQNLSTSDALYRKKYRNLIAAGKGNSDEGGSNNA